MLERRASLWSKVPCGRLALLLSFEPESYLDSNVLTEEPDATTVKRCRKQRLWSAWPTISLIIAMTSQGPASTSTSYLSGVTFTFPHSSTRLPATARPSAIASASAAAAAAAEDEGFAAVSAQKTGVIAGVAAGCGLLIALGIIVTYTLVRRRRRRTEVSSHLDRWLRRTPKRFPISNPIYRDSHDKAFNRLAPTGKAPTAPPLQHSDSQSPRLIPRKPAPALLPPGKMMSRFFASGEIAATVPHTPIVVATAGQPVVRKPAAVPAPVEAPLPPIPSAPRPSRDSIRDSSTVPAPSRSLHRRTMVSIRTAFSRKSSATAEGPSRRPTVARCRDDEDASRVDSGDIRISLWPSSPTETEAKPPDPAHLSIATDSDTYMSDSGRGSRYPDSVGGDFGYDAFPLELAEKARQANEGRLSRATEYAM